MREAVFQDALRALRNMTGAEGKVVSCQGCKAWREPKTILDISINGKTESFLAEVKAADRISTIAQVKANLDRLLHNGFRAVRPLLVTPYITHQLAEECRRLNLSFIDTAGNAYIRMDDVFLYITGQPRAQRYEHEVYRANTQAGLRIVFALLCRPDLIAGTYREIAKLAGVALGTVGPVLKDLAQRGFVRRTKAKGTKLQNAEKLLNEWVSRYPETLRPKLNPRRYRGDDKNLREADLDRLQAYWSGERAAEVLTGYLRAEQYTIYTRGLPQEVLAALRLRLDPGGNVELLTAFWLQELADPNQAIVPSILVYADLMMTGEARNIETANVVYEQVVQPALLTN